MNHMNTHNSTRTDAACRVCTILLCVFLACIPNTALAETAQELAARLNAYGFSAAVRPAPNNNNVTVVNNPLGSTLTKNEQLPLNIDFSVTIEWGANLTGSTANALVAVSGLGTVEIERGTTGAINISGMSPDGGGEVSAT